MDDYTTWTGLANERRQVTADIEARTALTLAYNRELRAWARQHGCAYLDLDPALIDPITGILRDEFRNPDPTDHHLNPGPLAELVARQFAELDWTVSSPIRLTAPARRRERLSLTAQIGGNGWIELGRRGIGGAVVWWCW